MSPRTLWALITAVGIIPAAVIGFWLGIPETEPTPPPPPVEVEPVASELSFPTLSLGPRAVGEWRWSELRGGECIDPYESAWQQRYQVVSCEAPHQAEFVRAIIADDNPDSPYPGEQALSDLAREHCERWEREQLNNPESFDDLIVEGAYSLGEDAWGSGDRLLGCFVSQQDGEPFITQLVG